jgi:hypothetical protein
MNSESEFKKIVGRLRIDDEPNPVHKERLRRQMLSVFERSAGTVGTTSLHRISARIIGIPVVKIAVAAIIVVVVLIGISKYGGRANGTKAALNGTMQAIEKMPWMHLVVKEYHKEGQETIREHWLNFAARQSFAVYPGQAIWCWDYGNAQRQFLYKPSMKTLTISDLPAGGFYGTSTAHNLMNVFLVHISEAGAHINVRRDRLGQKQVMVYEMEKSRPDDGMSIGRVVVGRMRYRVFIDKETKLVLAGRIEYLDRNGGISRRHEWQADYPQSGPADIYALGVPSTARIIDNSKGPIGTPGNEPMPMPTPAPK